MRRRSFLGGLSAAAVPGAAWAMVAQPCGEDERRRLLKFSLIDEAYACGGAVVGPPSTSAFLTADFTSKMNYVSPGVGQMQIAQQLWGTSSGNAGDNGFQPLTLTNYTDAMAKINFGLWVFVGGLDSAGWFNSNLTVNTTTMANLTNNFSKVDPLGIAKIILGINFAGQGSSAITNQSQWNTAMTNLATYWFNGGNGRLMPNNKPVPIAGFTAQNEPSTDATAQSYYTNLVSIVHGVNPSYLVVGPQGASFAGPPNGITVNTFMNAVSNMDVIDWDSFISQGTLGTQLWANSGFRNWEQGTVTNILNENLPYLPKAFLIMGNVDTNCADVSMQNYTGAIWDTFQTIGCANVSPVQMWNGRWDTSDDGVCGTVDYGSNVPNANSVMTTFPLGFFRAQAVRKIYGPRWGVPNNAAGLLTCAVTPAAGRLGLLATNAGQGAQNSKSVALSHWPVNTSGAGTANVWQMTSATSTGNGKGDGVSSTIPVVNGVTTTNAAWPSGLSFPDPSITIISI